jgi:hypothetical protein
MQSNEKRASRSETRYWFCAVQRVRLFFFFANVFHHRLYLLFGQAVLTS